MKNPNFWLIVLMMTTVTISAQKSTSENDSTGADFSLEGALAMFKQANSVADFEKMINEEGNNVNNLDLDGDGDTDYITVNDIKDGDTHVLVLTTFVNATEKQDIATIGIEKTGAESAVLQIEGDESLYAANTIVEPEDTVQASQSGKGGPAVSDLTFSAALVNVWFWPGVRFIYAPGYVIYASPWRYRAYPGWWRPWHPQPRTVFYTRTAPHRVYYHRAPVRRVAVARKVYAPRRHSSTLVVHNRKGTAVIHKNRRGNVKAVKVKKRPANRRRK